MRQTILVRRVHMLQDPPYTPPPPRPPPPPLPSFITFSAHTFNFSSHNDPHSFTLTLWDLIGTRTVNTQLLSLQNVTLHVSYLAQFQVISTTRPAFIFNKMLCSIDNKQEPVVTLVPKNNPTDPSVSLPFPHQLYCIQTR